MGPARGQSSQNPQLQTHRVNQGSSNTDGRDGVTRGLGEPNKEETVPSPLSCKHSGAGQSVEPKLKPPLPQWTCKISLHSISEVSEHCLCEAINREEQLQTMAEMPKHMTTAQQAVLPSNPTELAWASEPMSLLPRTTRVYSEAAGTKKPVP